MDRQLGDSHRNQQFARSLSQRRRENLLKESLTVKSRAQAPKRVEEASQRLAAEHILIGPGPCSPATIAANLRLPPTVWLINARTSHSVHGVAFPS